MARLLGGFEFPRSGPTAKSADIPVGLAEGQCADEDVGAPRWQVAPVTTTRFNLSRMNAR